MANWKGSFSTSHSTVSWRLIHTVHCIKSNKGLLDASSHWPVYWQKRNIYVVNAYFISCTRSYFRVQRVCICNLGGLGRHAYTLPELSMDTVSASILINFTLIIYCIENQSKLMQFYGRASQLSWGQNKKKTALQRSYVICWRSINSSYCY